MKLIIAVIIILIGSLSGCSTTNDEINKELVQNNINSFYDKFELSVDKYQLDTQGWSDAILDKIVSTSFIKYENDSYIMEVNVITPEVLQNIISNDPYFKAELVDTILKEHDEAYTKLADFIISIYDTSVTKNKIRYVVSQEDLDSSSFGFIVELYNVHCIGVIRNTLDSFIVSLKEEEISDIRRVAVGESIPINYQNKSGIVLTIDELLVGKDAVEYLSSLSSTNALQTINPNTEIKIVKYTVENMTNQIVDFDSYIVLATKDLRIYNSNEIFAGELTSESLNPESNSELVSILIGEIENSYVYWYDTLSQETFIVVDRSKHD